MSFCDTKIHYPYFVITQIYRNLSPVHYIFVGKELYEKYNRVWKSIENKEITSYKEILPILGKYVIEHIQKSIAKKEKIICINDNIWTDEVLFSIKKKIFVYGNKIIPNYQHLWMVYKNEEIVLDTRSVEKSIISTKPFIDTNYVNDSNEYIGKKVDNDINNMILYDIIDIEYNPHIFVYDLEDELEWINNNPIMENKNEVIKERYMYGYIKKYWPFFDFWKTKKNQIQNIYNTIENSLQVQKDIIYEIRNSEKTSIKLSNCIINNFVLISRNTEDYNYYLLNIYNFLRTLLSEKIPYIYYTSYGDNIPYISVYQKSINTKISKLQLREWTYKRIGTNKYILKGTPGIINIKVLYYSEKDIHRYVTLRIHKNGQIDILIKYDQKISSKEINIEKHFSYLTLLLEKINGYLQSLKRDTFIIPTLQIKNEFILSENTKIQYFTISSYIEYNKKIDLKKFYSFLSIYKPFVNVSFENKSKNSISFFYERVSNSYNIKEIYDYIEKESKEKTSEEIIEDIIRNFGKSLQKARELYNEWSILQEDKTSASQIIKHSGVIIKIIEDTIEKNRYTYKVTYDNLKSLFILRNCYKFLEKVLHIFLLSDRKVKKDELFDNSVDIHFGFGEIQRNNNIKKDIFIQDEELVKTNKDSNSTFTSSLNINLSDESMLDTKTKLQCSKEENKIIEKGVCKDVCEFSQFKLKRLFTFDSKLFKFSQSSDTNVYARQCPTKKRPIVVSYDPSKEVDKEAITYFYKYGSNPEKQYYYMCPEAWCPTCEKPIPIDKIKNIQKKKCTFGKCPYGNHNVLINEEGKDFKYPGFLQQSRNPNGMCLPCCFSRDKRDTLYYKRCLSIKNTNNEENINEKYISRGDKIKINENRFALLTEDVGKYIGQKNCESGNIKIGFDCYVRKGTKEHDKNSFINLLIDVISGIQKKEYTYTMIINEIEKKLTDSLFISLSEGLVKRMFSTKKNYIQYLQKNKNIKIFLLDIVSRPGIFCKEGFNIIIFTQNTITCEKGTFIQNLYSFHKPTLLCLFINNIYQPIYKLQNIKKNIEEIILHSSLLPEIQKILQIAKVQCKSYNEINWEDISKNKHNKVGL